MHIGIGIGNIVEPAIQEITPSGLNPRLLNPSTPADPAPAPKEPVTSGLTPVPGPWRPGPPKVTPGEPILDPNYKPPSPEEMAAWRAVQEKKEQEQKDDMERAQVEVHRLAVEIYDERSRRRAAAASGDKKAWFPSDDQTSWENEVARIGDVSRGLNWYTPNKMEAALQSRRKLVSAGLIPDQGTETVVAEDGPVDMNTILMLAAIGAGIFLLTRNS